MDNKPLCNNCPLRLFNNKGYNLQSVGTPIYGCGIIIPNVDKEAYNHQDLDFSNQVDTINNIIISSTGGLATEYLRIMPLIRCKETNKCQITSDIVNRCLNYLIREIRDLGINKILFLGSSLKRFYGNDYNVELGKIYNNGQIYFASSYSPNIKYYDEEKYKLFETHLLNFYSFCKS